MTQSNLPTKSNFLLETVKTNLKIDNKSHFSSIHRQKKETNHWKIIRSGSDVLKIGSIYTKLGVFLQFQKMMSDMKKMLIK